MGLFGAIKGLARKAVKFVPGVGPIIDEGLGTLEALKGGGGGDQSTLDKILGAAPGVLGALGTGAGIVSGAQQSGRANEITDRLLEESRAEGEQRAGLRGRFIKGLDDKAPNLGSGEGGLNLFGANSSNPFSNNFTGPNPENTAQAAGLNALMGQSSRGVAEVSSATPLSSSESSPPAGPSGTGLAPSVPMSGASGASNQFTGPDSELGGFGRGELTAAGGKKLAGENFDPTANSTEQLLAAIDPAAGQASQAAQVAQLAPDTRNDGALNAFQLLRRRAQNQQISRGATPRRRARAE